MTLLFMDSFDHYDTLLDKWLSETGTNSISAGNGRRGSDALYYGPGEGYVISRAFPATDVLTVGFAFYIPDWTGMDANRLHYIPHFLSSGGTREISLQIDFATKVLKVKRGMTIANTGTLLASGTIPISVATWYYIEIQVYIHDANGTVEVKINGVTDINFGPGDTLHVSADITNVGFGGWTSCPDYYIDDLYILDDAGADNNDFLGDSRVDPLFADGAGASTDMTPSAGANWQCVDENPPDDDATYVSENNVGDHDTYTYDDIPVLAGAVFGIQQNLFARKDDAGARSIKGMIRSGGADYEGTDVHALSDSYLYFLEIFEQDPDTAVAWLLAGIDAGEFGQKLEA